MQKKNFLKKIFGIAFIFLLGFVLASCKLSSKNVPWGDLKDDRIILKSNDGKFSISEKQLYNILRPQSSTILKKLIDKAALEDYYKKIDLTKPEHKEFLLKELNKTVFGDEKEKNFKFLTKDQIWQKFIAFKNKRDFLKDFPINLLEQKVTTEIEKDAKDRDFTNYADEILLLEKNKLAQKLIARDYLTEAKNGKGKNQALVDIKDDTNYINPDTAYLPYFQEKMLKWDMSFFAFTVVSDYEFNLLLMNNGLEFDTLYNITKSNPLKAKSNGNKFFQIPDIRTWKDADSNVIDLTNEKFKKFKQFLEDDLIKKGHFNKSIRTIEDLKNHPERVTEQDFKNYWNNYKFTDIETEVKAENGDLLKVFVDFYNRLHNTNLTVVTNTTDPTKLFKIMDGSEEFKTFYTKDEIDEIQYKKYLYDELKFKKKDNGTIDFSDGSFYSIKPSSSTFGSDDNKQKVIAYKIWEDRTELEKVYDFKDKKFKNDADAKDKLKTIKVEIKEKLIEQKANETLGKTRFEELLKDKKVFIFDPIIRISFDKNKVAYSNKKYFLNNDIVAKVGDKEIKVRDLYDELYKTVGLSIAISYISDKFIYDKYQNKLEQKDKEEAEKTLKQTIQSFSQGRDQSYDAKIGKDLYLQHKFGYNTFDEVLQHKFYVDKAKTFFSKDLPNLLDNYYVKVHEISNDFYAKKLNAKVSHVLFSVDKDLDGKPDNPSTLSSAEITEIENAIGKLALIIKEEAQKGTKVFNDNLKAVIEDYKKATRYVKVRGHFASNAEYNAYKKTPDYIYGEAKRAGISLKFESLGTIDETKFSTYDVVFHNRVKALYEACKPLDEKNFPYVDFDENSYSDPSSFEKIRSSFGWHAINIESIEKTKSAKTEKEYKSELKKPDGTQYVVPVNPQEKVSLEQVEVYIRESNSKYGVKITESTAIKEQLTTILGKLNVYGDLGYIFIVKTLDLKSDIAEIETDFQQFKANLKDNFYNNSKYNQAYQNFWGTDLLDKFGL